MSSVQVQGDLYGHVVEDGEVQFLQLTPRKYTLTKFDTFEEASLTYNMLRQHTHKGVAKVLPAKQIDGSIFLTWEKRGECLRDIPSQHLFQWHHLLPKYQNIISTLFEVLKHMIDHGLEWEPKIESIFVIEDANPLVTLVGLKRGCTNLTNGCQALGLLIQKINIMKNYTPGKNTDMGKFLECLISQRSGWMKEVCESPLPWTFEEVVLYICDVVQMLSDNEDLIANDGMPTVFNNYNATYDTSNTLKGFDSVCKDHEAKKAEKHNITSKPSGSIFMAARLSRQSVEQLRGCHLLRNCLAHFFPKKFERGANTGVFFTLEDVLIEFEKLFPNLVSNLMEAEQMLSGGMLKFNDLARWRGNITLAPTTKHFLKDLLSTD